MLRSVCVTASSLSAAFALAVAACDGSSGSYDAPPVQPPADDPGCRVYPAPKLGPCTAADAAFPAIVDAGAQDATPSDAATDAMTDAAPPPPPPEDAGGPSLPALSSCSAGASRLVACRQGTALATTPGNDGDAYVLAVGTRAQLVSFKGAANEITKLEAFATSGDSAALLTTPNGEPFVVARLSGKLSTQIGSAPPAAVPGGEVSYSLGSGASNTRGSLLLTLLRDGSSSEPSGLLRRSDGSISIVPSVRAENIHGRTLGLTDDDETFLFGRRAASGSSADGQAVLFMKEGEEPIDFPQARFAFARSTPSGTPPVVVLERSALLVGIWDAAARRYGYAKALDGVSPCPAAPGCDNQCRESGDEAAPAMISVARDRDGTTAVVYIRRRITRERRYRKVTSDNILCDLFGCKPSCEGEELGQKVERAELVILEVDSKTRTAYERFAIELPPRPNATTGYDVGVDRTNGSALHTALHDGHLLVTFDGAYSSGFPAVSLFDVRLR